MIGSPPSPASTIRAWPVLLVVGVGTLLSATAGSAINLALPDLGRDMGISIESSRWILQAFLLVTGVLLPVAGKLGDLVGHRAVYLTGFAIFGLGSLACGLANSFAALVAFRVLQAVGGAAVMAVGPALLTTSFPPSMRGRALGMVSTATYTGLTVGPPLGGLIVSALSWRWTFFLNLPFAVVILLVGHRFLPRTRSTQKTEFDWPGAVTLIVALPLLLLALSESTRWGFGSWQTVLTAIFGLAGMTAFAFIERRRSAPLFHFALFRSRIFTGAVLSAVANYIALFVAIVLLPFYVVEGLGRTEAHAGLLLAVQPLVMAIVTSPSGWLSDRIGTRALATTGMLIMSAGLFGLSFLETGGGEVAIAGCLAIVGLGTGTFISPNSSALMGAAPRTLQGTAGSLLAEARILGMLIGVSAATVIFHAAGGQTGIAWRPVEFDAFQMALRVGAAVAVLGALAAALRGKEVRASDVLET